MKLMKGFTLKFMFNPQIYLKLVFLNQDHLTRHLFAVACLGFIFKR